MTFPNDPLTPTTVQVAPAQATTQNYSRRTLAHFKETAEKLVDVRRSMLDDMSRRPFQNPQEGLQAIMELQNIQNQVSELQKTIQSGVAEDFSSKDVEAIEAMKQRKVPEEKIAEYFDTNQSKINRLRHGKIAVTEE
nr:hypothetical protein [uncultured Pseudomonas sp.]